MLTGGAVRKLKISIKWRRKFGKTSETVEGICFVVSVIGLYRLNTGKDHDDDKGYTDNYLLENAPHVPHLLC
jgi:hypothetical protein